MQLVQFTNQAGNPVWVQPKAVVLVRDLQDGERGYVDDLAQTVLILAESRGTPLLIAGKAAENAERINRRFPD